MRAKHQAYCQTLDTKELGPCVLHSSLVLAQQSILLHRLTGSVPSSSVRISLLPLIPHPRRLFPSLQPSAVLAPAVWQVKARRLGFGTVWQPLASCLRGVWDEEGGRSQIFLHHSSYLIIVPANLQLPQRQPPNARSKRPLLLPQPLPPTRFPTVICDKSIRDAIGRFDSTPIFCHLLERSRYSIPAE